MSKFKHAYGYCDKTGFRYPLKDLVPEYRDGRPTGFKVGKDVVDKDHPQYKLSEVTTDDPTPIDDPRPDVETKQVRALTAWNPVGGGLREYGTQTLGLHIDTTVGKVTVS